MANTASAIKRVRQAVRKRTVNQPRRSAAKTLVAKALVTATTTGGDDAVTAVQAAVSALDRAAKSGAIHRNAADRRKSRLMLKVNALLAGAEAAASTRTTRGGKAAQVKAAKARVAASRAVKAKGEQTAAGKARAALTRSTREATAGQTGGPTGTATRDLPAAAASPRSTLQTGAAPAGAPERKTRSTTVRSAKGAAGTGTASGGAKPRQTRTARASAPATQPAEDAPGSSEG